MVDEIGMEGKKEKEVKLGDAFFKDMEEFFKQIESEQKVKEMRIFEKNSLKVIEEKKEKKEQQEMGKEKVKYAEKVKSYSKYLIGRKLSKNLQPYSKAEMEEENLTTDNSALMRILTKWCEELEGNFFNLETREEPFRTEDQKENYINIY